VHGIATRIMIKVCRGQSGKHANWDSPAQKRGAAHRTPPT
jgi:hypothetical protein